MTASELADLLVERLHDALRPNRNGEFLRAHANGTIRDEVVVELHDPAWNDEPVQSFLITIEETD